jgi:predicted transposase YdaD
MPEMDQGIKRLIQTHPADVLALALPGAEYLGTLPVDVATEPQLVLDTLLRVRYNGQECAVNIEVEARPDAEMGWRLFKYGTRATTVMDRVVLSIVLWLQPNGAPPRSPYELRVGDEVWGTWKFIGIEVYKLRAQTLFDRELVGLLPLIPFTQDGADLAVIEQTADLVKHRAPAAEVEELETLLAIFGARTFGREAMLRLLERLHVSTEILESSPLYQYWLRQVEERGLQRGLEQGEARGLQRGLEQGEEAGLREAALTALRGRFPNLPPEIAQAIATASREALMALLANVAADSLEQVRARLGI